MWPTQEDARKFWAERVVDDVEGVITTRDLLAAFNAERAKHGDWPVTSRWFTPASRRAVAELQRSVDYRQARVDGVKVRGWWGARLTT